MTSKFKVNNSRKKPLKRLKRKPRRSISKQPSANNSCKRVASVASTHQPRNPLINLVAEIARKGAKALATFTDDRPDSFISPPKTTVARKPTRSRKPQFKAENLDKGYLMFLHYVAKRVPQLTHTKNFVKATELWRGFTRKQKDDFYKMASRRFPQHPTKGLPRKRRG